MFYTYRQNNSGGYFDTDKNRGISVFVIVEADSAEHADRKAGEIGLYFDGEGDCECCGSRWSETWESDGEEFPHIYGESAWNYDFRWELEDIDVSCYIHYLDGRTIPVLPKDKRSALHSLDDIKAAHTGHFFDSSTKSFFNSRISTKVYPVPSGAFFVTSERGGGFGGYTPPRYYTVRHCTTDGNIVTVGGFQQYDTSRQAHAAAKRLQDAENN